MKVVCIGVDGMYVGGGRVFMLVIVCWFFSCNIWGYVIV
jgi:hypothetical protein